MNCTNCQYKTNDPDEFCYMFKEEPISCSRGDEISGITIINTPGGHAPLLKAAVVAAMAVDGPHIVAHRTKIHGLGGMGTPIIGNDRLFDLFPSYLDDYVEEKAPAGRSDKQHKAILQLNKRRRSHK